MPGDRLREAACRLLLAARPRLARRLATLRREERLSPADAAALGLRRLGDLVSHAAARVPYYRDPLANRQLARANGEIDPMRFAELPLLDKETIRRNFHALRSDDLAQRRWFETSSGGSTGVPVRVVQDAEYAVWAAAVKLRFDEWTGYRPGRPRAILWGSERDLLFGGETRRRRLGRWLRNETWTNAFRMTPGDMRALAARLATRPPAQILAYAGALYELAAFAEREGLSLGGPDALLTSAGPLYPHMRTTLERAFRVPVFDRYGCREVGDIACECEAHRGLHVSLSTHYLEIVRPDGSPADPGESGEIVVTCLVNRAMPLLRYRIGDLGAWEQGACPCGRGWPRLRAVEGRLVETLVRADGGIVSPNYLIHLLGVTLERGWVAKCQFVQESPEALRVRIVPQEAVEVARARHDADIVEICAKVRAALGDACDVRVEFVDAIPPAPSGKHQYVISRVGVPSAR